MGAIGNLAHMLYNLFPGILRIILIMICIIRLLTAPSNPWIFFGVITPPKSRNSSFFQRKAQNIIFEKWQKSNFIDICNCFIYSFRWFPKVLSTEAIIASKSPLHTPPVFTSLVQTLITEVSHHTHSLPLQNTLFYHYYPHMRYRYWELSLWVPSAQVRAIQGSVFHGNRFLPPQT